MAYFKRQVKSLTDQIQQQQQKITELRYRSTSPGPVPLGTVRLIRYLSWELRCGLQIDCSGLNVGLRIITPGFYGDANQQEIYHQLLYW